MGGKNEILLSIALEGDEDVKRKLDGIGASGSKLGHISKDIEHANSKFGELGKGAGEASEKLGKVFEPFLEQAGLTGLVGGTGGFFGRLIGALRSPTGIASVVGAGLATLAEHLAEVSRQSEKTKSRLEGLGGGKKAFDDLNDSAKKAGVSSASLAPGTEKYLQARGRAQANSAIQYAPGFEPKDGFTANVLGGRQRDDLGTKSDYEAEVKTLIDGSKQDKLGSKEAIAAIGKLNDSLYANGHLTGNAVREFQQDAPNDANRLARAFGRGDAFRLAKVLDEEKTPSISAGDVFRKLKQEAPNAAKDAEKNRTSTDATERLQAKLGELDEALGKQIGKPVDKLQTKAIDKLADGVEAATKNFEHNSEAVKEATQKLLHNDVTDFFKKAFTDPGALKAPEKAKGEPSKGEPSNADGGFANSAAAKAMQQSAQKSDQAAAAQAKAASDHSKAASDLSKAASDLSAAGKDSKEAAKDAKDASSDNTQARTTATRNSANDAAGVSRPVGSRGIVEDLTTHSGSHPDTQVSGDGSRAQDRYDFEKMLADQKAIGEYEGDKQNEFSKSIRDQLGIKAEEPKGERLYPGGPARYRQPDSSREPAELGTYDDNMNFVPNKRQPYGRLREKPYFSDRPYNKREDTYDTKGGGDANPIYNFGQPQPLDFPNYDKSMRGDLPGVPLPRPDPRAPGPQSELQPPAQPQPPQPAALQPAAFQQGPLPPQPPALVETIASSITSLLDQLRERMVGPQNTKIEGPVDAVGIRGDASPQGEQPAQNVAALDGAAGGAAEGLRQVASAAPAAATNLSNSGNKGGEPVTAKDGGFIRRFDGGGAVGGPGTSTSDDIPARLSDGEYVVNARETSRNRSALDAINSGHFTKAISRMFARGGAVRKLAGGGYMGTGVTEDNFVSGSITVDGVTYNVKSLAELENIQKQADAANARNQAEYNAREQKIKATRHKSDFTGFFGSSSTFEDQEHQAGSQLDPFADGGLVGALRLADGSGPVSGPGTTTSDDIPAMLSHGEFVVNARETSRNLDLLHAINSGSAPDHLSKKFAHGGMIEVPGFADGGGVNIGSPTPPAAPSTGDIASSGSQHDFAGYHAIDMRTDFGSFRAFAHGDVARSMAASARDSANAQTGQRPSWYKGR